MRFGDLVGLGQVLLVGLFLLLVGASVVAELLGHDLAVALPACEEWLVAKVGAVFDTGWKWFGYMARKSAVVTTLSVVAVLASIVTFFWSSITRFGSFTLGHLRTHLLQLGRMMLVAVVVWLIISFVVPLVLAAGGACIGRADDGWALALRCQEVLLAPWTFMTFMAGAMWRHFGLTLLLIVFLLMPTRIFGEITW